MSKIKCGPMGRRSVIYGAVRVEAVAIPGGINIETRWIKSKQKTCLKAGYYSSSPNLQPFQAEASRAQVGHSSVHWEYHGNGRVDSARL